MGRPAFRVVWSVLALVPLVGAARAADAQDALQLADEGKISIDAVAESAYAVRVRVRNHTPAALHVSFPPGLVADTYARFALFQVGGGGGTSGGGGGQSTGMLTAQVAEVRADGVAMLNFQTVCLNFGAPEPTPKTVLMLKRVEDFTADPVFQYLLKDLAARPAEEPVAQAALWHVVDKLDWKKLTAIRTRRGRFSDEELEEAQRRVDAARSAAASAGQRAEQERKAVPLRLPPLSVLIHPDPRGRRQDAESARNAARRLRGRWPGVDVSHRDFTPPPADEEADAVAWCFLIRSVGSAKAPDLQLTSQRNVWDPSRKRWKHEPVGPSVTRTPPKEEVGAWLADLVVQQIAARSLVVEKKAEGRLLVRNDSPARLEEVFIATATPRDKALKLLGLTLDPGEAKEAAVPAEHQERFAAARKIVGAAFTPTTAKARPGG